MKENEMEGNVERMGERRDVYRVFGEEI